AEYAMTAAVWVRGFLQDDYGVRVQDVQWSVGGQEEPGRKERMDLHLPPEISVSSIAPDKTLNGMLENEEIDGLIAARVPSCFVQGSPKVRRLFPDYKAVEVDYYKRTKIFPIMHLLVVHKRIYDRNPWVARSLYKAFCQAKERAIQTINIPNPLPYTLPWLSAEREQLEAIFGTDWWPYGIGSNRHTLETLIQYMYEQGLTEKSIEIDELFAPNVIGEFKL
ncbi:MAG: ABC transporter substrate-binding protein, partial [Candidatus Binatia bacterium]